MSALSEVVEAVEPLIARHARSDPGPGRFHFPDADPDRLFVLEAVYEGYLMHYASPRAFDGMEPDLQLLAGDALYALGLSRLAQGEDIEAVTELSDLISLTAQAQAEGDPERAERLWEASSELLARGSGDVARRSPCSGGS